MNHAKPAKGILLKHALSSRNIDNALLNSLLTCWDVSHGIDTETVEYRRLFRALDAARAASRMPGGSDSTFYESGRSIALWISAFEILAYKGKSGIKEVLALFRCLEWRTPALRTFDRSFQYNKGQISINLAGEIYRNLFQIRNDFLHGNPVTRHMLRILPRQVHILYFAAPLFRLALASYLSTIAPIAEGRFTESQRTYEEALMVFDYGR